VKFGLNFTPVFPAAMAELARRAEERGFESLWVGENVLVPFDGVAERDPANWKPTSRFLEPWAALSHMAAVPTTVRLGTCLAVLPMHSPVHLAPPSSRSTSGVASSWRPPALTVGSTRHAGRRVGLERRRVP
jgi:hypothetical protein